MRRRILFLTAVALVAFAGVAYGASQITGSQIKDNTITGKDVKNKSLTLTDFKGSVSGPRGLTGPQGPQGGQGPAGPTAVGQLTIVQSPQEFFGPSDAVMGAQAFCPAGQRVVSGGGVSISDEQLAATEPSNDRTSWFVIGIDQVFNGGEYVQAEAICAPTGQAVAASPSRAKARAELARAMTRIAKAKR